MSRLRTAPNGAHAGPSGRLFAGGALGALVVGVVAVVVYAYTLDKGSVLAVGLLVALAAYATGGLLGFLFAIPRVIVSPAADAGAASNPAAGLGSLRSNTNLEEISDWLTKILVGVGLVELGRISTGGSRLMHFLAPALGDKPSSPGFALAVTIFFAVGGFLSMYYVTRVFIAPAFKRTEDDLRARVEQLRAELEGLRVQRGAASGPPGRDF